MDAETWFIRNFVRRERRERVNYELSSAAKRANCIWTLTMAGNDRLDSCRIHELPSSASWEHALQLMKERGCCATTRVWIMSRSSVPNAQGMTLADAMKTLWDVAPFVIICPEQGAALTAGESGGYAPWRAILY